MRYRLLLITILFAPLVVRAEPAPPEAAARQMRQQIIANFDKVADRAESEYKFKVDRLSVLSACADQSASAEHCKTAADSALEELEIRIDNEKVARKNVALTPTPVTNGVTIVVRPPRVYATPTPR